jgi:hypothetical protein
MRVHVSWRNLVGLALLGALATAPACRCDRGAQTARRAGPVGAVAPGSAPASQPGSAPASQPGSASASQPGSAPASAAAPSIPNPLLRRVRDFAAGKVPLATMWRELMQFSASHAKKQPAVAQTARMNESFRGSFEFLQACRAIENKKPELCDAITPVGGKSVARCRFTATFFRVFLHDALAAKKCGPTTWASVADLGINTQQAQDLCTALAQRDATKCPKAPSLRAGCLAYATKDPAQCGAAGTGADKAHAEADCRSSLTVLEAISAGDATLIRGDTQWSGFGAALLGTRGRCEARFVDEVIRWIPPMQ